MPQHKKKLALICTSLNELGGKNNHLKNIYLHFKKKDWAVHIVCASKIEPELASFMQKEGVDSQDLIFFPRVKKWFVLPFMRDLKCLIQKNQYDIVHLFQIQSDALGALAARWAGAKNILSYYESTFIEDNISLLKVIFYKTLNALVRPFIKKTVVVSYGLKEEIAQKKYRDDASIEVIHLGIKIPEDMERASFDTQRLEQAKPVIGTIGRFSHEKALDRFVCVMPLIVQKFPDAKFVLIGKGPLEDSLKQLARDLNVYSYVEWKSWTDNVYKELEAMDIFIMSSFREGCPTALLEAMVAKRPVVASDIEGIKDIVVHEESGLLVDTRDTQAFAQTLIMLCQNPSKAAQLAESGFKRVKDNFVIDEEMKKLENLYLSLLT